MSELENESLGFVMLSHVSLRRMADKIEEKYQTDKSVNVELFLTPYKNGTKTIGVKIK